jgi:hypothetical protein
MHEKTPLSRRDFIGKSVAILGIPTALGISKTVSEMQKQQFYENFPAVPINTFPGEQEIRSTPLADSLDTLKNPYFRASTVSFHHGDHIFGHGSLVDVNGNVAVYTVGHVAALTRERPTHVSIPSIGTTQISAGRMVDTTVARKEEDPSSYYVFAEDNQAILRTAAEAEELRIFSRLFAAPRKGDHVAVPRYDKGFLRYTFINYDKWQNLLMLEGTDMLTTQSCFGDSGSPILRLETDAAGQEFLTGDVYGVLQGKPPEDNAIDPVTGRTCSKSRMYARPNN